MDDRPSHITSRGSYIERANMKMFVFVLFLVWDALISPVASQLSPLVRKNTQCASATIIPSNVTTLHPYIDNSNTTFDVNSTRAAVRENAPPQIYTCPNNKDGYGSYDPTKIRGVKSAIITISFPQIYSHTIPSPNGLVLLKVRPAARVPTQHRPSDKLPLDASTTTSAVCICKRGRRIR